MYIYIFGGNSETEEIEVLDTTLEFEAKKCDLISLNINTIPRNLHATEPKLLIGKQIWQAEYTPQFKECIIPLEELIYFGNFDI